MTVCVGRRELNLVSLILDAKCSAEHRPLSRWDRDQRDSEEQISSDFTTLLS